MRINRYLETGERSQLDRVATYGYRERYAKTVTIALPVS